MRRSDGYVVSNSYEMPTGAFTRDPEARLPTADIAQRLSSVVAEDRSLMVNATQMALGLLGDAIAANLFLLGVAFQRGLIPLSAAAIEQAITLNNVAIEQSKQAFLWGRQWVVDPDMVAATLASKSAGGLPASQNRLDNLDDLIADRTARLTAYQNAGYGAKYQADLAAIIKADTDPTQKLSKAAARYLYKMMAIKDEYEVARLYSDSQFSQQIAQMFEGDVRLSVHLAPPLLARMDRRQAGLVNPHMADGSGLLSGPCGICARLARYGPGCIWLYPRAPAREKSAGRLSKPLDGNL